MKQLFSIFLSVYIVALTLSPCLDNEIRAGAATYDMINSNQDCGHSDQEACCSPFCTCSCCNLPFETAKTFIVTRDFLQPIVLIFFFNPQIESQYLFTIWEPPKA